MKSISIVDKIVFNIIKESSHPMIPSRINYLAKIVQLKEMQFGRELPFTWTRRGNFYFSDEVSISLNKLVKYNLLKKHQVRILSSGNVQFSYEIVAGIELPISKQIKSMIISLKSRKYYSCKTKKILDLISELS